MLGVDRSSANALPAFAKMYAVIGSRNDRILMSTRCRSRLRPSIRECCETGATKLPHPKLYIDMGHTSQEPPNQLYP